MEINNFFNKNNNMPTKPVRCAIYTRKSTEKGLELEYTSLDSQYDSCVNYITSQKDKNWVLVDKKYEDAGFSGKNLKRPAVKELLNDIKLGLIDVVVVYKIDRLSRSLYDFVGLLKLFEETKSTFVSVTQNFSTEGAMGKFMINIMMSFSQLEREMASDRVGDKVYSQKKRGMWTGGIVPLGYDIEDKKLIINEQEAEIIRFIFNTFIETKSVLETARLGNAKGYRTKTHTSRKGITRHGKKLDRSTVYRIVKNPLYCGKMANYKTNEIFDGKHEAIVNEELYLKANSIKEENKQTTIFNRTRKSRTLPNKGKVPYLLRGIMKCECCNSTLTPTYTRKVKNGKDIIYRYYKPHRVTKGLKCEVGNIPAEQLENIVLNQIHKILQSPETVANVIKEIKPHNKHLNISQQDIIDSLKNIETVWSELFPKEQVQILNMLVKDIIVSPTNLRITFKNSGFVKLISEASSNININTKDNNKETSLIKTTEINIAIDFRKRGGKSYITTPHGKECKIVQAETKDFVNTSSSQINKPLVVRLIKAGQWRQEILQSKGQITINKIAKRENVTKASIYQIYNLNYIAPDIKKAILTGNTPTDLSVRQLKASATVLDWDKQREMWGFTNY